MKKVVFLSMLFFGAMAVQAQEHNSKNRVKYCSNQEMQEIIKK